MQVEVSGNIQLGIHVAQGEHRIASFLGLFQEVSSHDIMALIVDLKLIHYRTIVCLWWK